MKNIVKENLWKLYWYFKKVRLPNSPLVINVEPTSGCNLKCKFCSLDGSRKNGFMDFTLFVKIIDEAKDFGLKIARLFLAGEPLLHKNLPEMIKYAKEAGLNTEIYTNATLLNRACAEKILSSGLDIINFSFNGGEGKERYEQYAVGAKYEETLNNCLTFLKLKKAKGLKKPLVFLSVLREFNENNKSLELDENFKALFKDLPLDMLVSGYPHNHVGEKNNFGIKPRGGYYFPCKELWFSLNVFWDGRVAACCYDLNGRVIIGDVKTSSLKEIWNNDKMVGMRTKLINKEYEDIVTCRRCNQLWPYFHPVYREITHWPFFLKFYRKFFSMFLFNFRKKRAGL